MGRLSDPRYASNWSFWLAPLTILPTPLSMALGACVVGVSLTGLALTPSMATMEQKFRCVLHHALPVIIVLALGSDAGCRLGFLPNLAIFAAAAGTFMAVDYGHLNDVYYGKQWLMAVTAGVVGTTYLLMKC